MSEPFNVSQSKLKTYRRCHYAYHLRYVEKLRRKRKSRPLAFGSLVHTLLEAHANGDDWEDKLTEVSKVEGKMFREELEAYGELIEDVRVIMTSYFANWPDKDLRFVRLNKRNAEHHFDVEIAPGINANGLIDAIGQTPNKLRWIVEHKSFGNQGAPNEDERWRNLQSAVYIRIVDMLGWKAVDGMLWDYIRSKPPSFPELLKNGTVGKRLPDTLPERLASWLKTNKVSDDDKRTLVDHALSNRKRYFQRIFNPVKKQVVDRVFSDFVTTAQEMAERHGKVKCKNIDRHCSWCDYEAICRAELTASDVDFVKEREYVIESKKGRADEDRQVAPD